MRTLYHWPLDPLSRQVRIILGEKKLKFRLELINPWEISDDFLALSPEGRPPIFIDVSSRGQATLSGVRSICEYIDETNPKLSLLPGSPENRAEARRLCDWFNIKFLDEVSAYILHEKIEKIISRHSQPDLNILREGRQQLKFHLDYIEWLLEKRAWLAGPDISFADIAAGAHISCLDFVGEVNWKLYPGAKSWYQKFKSRPSMRPLLSDRLAGLIPPRHYSNLDF